MNDPVRLSKFLAMAGLSSRRKSDGIIRSGMVKVNNINVIEPYHMVEPDVDVVTIDNKAISLERRKYYFAVNKPVNYLSDLNFSDDRKLARSLIPIEVYIFPVGRLDYGSSGLMLFTNDGTFADRIMHPRYGVEKEYLAKLKGSLKASELEAVRSGLKIDGTVARFRSISEVRRAPGQDGNAWYRIILQEGRNRIIRKMADAIGHPVLRLKRVRIDGIELGSLRSGTFRELSERETRPFRIPSD